MPLRRGLEVRRLKRLSRLHRPGSSLRQEIVQAARRSRSRQLLVYFPLVARRGIAVQYAKGHGEAWRAERDQQIREGAIGFVVDQHVGRGDATVPDRHDLELELAGHQTQPTAAIGSEPQRFSM